MSGKLMGYRLLPPGSPEMRQTMVLSPRLRHSVSASHSALEKLKHNRNNQKKHKK